MRLGCVRVEAEPPAKNTSRLLNDWAAIMAELRRRERSIQNSPTGDLAEALVAEYYGVATRGERDGGL